MTAFSARWAKASARAMTGGKALNASRACSGTGSPDADRHRGVDHIAIGQAAQRRGRVHVRRGERRVPGRIAAVVVELHVGGAAAGAAHGDQEHVGGRIPAVERAAEVGQRLVVRPAQPEGAWRCAVAARPRGRSARPSLGTARSRLPAARRRRRGWWPATARRCGPRTLAGARSAAPNSRRRVPAPGRGTRREARRGDPRRPRCAPPAQRTRPGGRRAQPCRRPAWRGCARAPVRRLRGALRRHRRRAS